MTSIKSSLQRLGFLFAATLGFGGHALAIETTCVASGGSGCVQQIPDGPRAGMTSTINVPAGICGSNAPTGVGVRVNITHNWIGDLTIAVTNPGAQTVTLLNQLQSPPSTSCGGDDVVATFRDGGSAAACQAATVPSLSGTVAATSSMAGLAASTTGTWTLTVTDNVNGNTGALNDWAVDVTCVALPPADMAVSFSGFPAFPAPNSTVNGTITCTNVGGTAATNVTCGVTGGTLGACTLQPANTPVASFPVASVGAGESITCAVSTQTSGAGQINIFGTTSATNDGNASNNATQYLAGLPINVPTLSETLIALLALLVAISAVLLNRRSRT
jgi:subtilisin-like proprotein convertase family protein